MKKQVEIRHATDEDYRSVVEILIDGARVAFGSIGGEPEDNTIYRDYYWIIPAIQTLVTKLDGDVTVVESPELFDD